MFAAIAAFGFLSCESDDDAERIDVNGGTLSGGPFTFFVDGQIDNVSGVSIDNTVVGETTTFIVTDDLDNILGIPPTIAALEGVNFDEAGVGRCFIYHLAYDGSITGLAAGSNLSGLQGDFDLSNEISVNRNAGPEAGTLSGAAYDFCVDGIPDMVSTVALAGTIVGSETTYVVTDADGNILGLPPTLEALEGVNFDDAGPGVCLIWHLAFEPGLQGAAVGENANDLQGVFDLSNSLTVNRTRTDGGTIEGGPFNFTVDGTPDMVSGITQGGDREGSLFTWIVTDADGKILGLPPTMTGLEGVNFDDAGVGVCLIWYIRYEEGIEGLAVDGNANELDGCFDLSNSLEVNRS